ncbi:M60 family metallopeptidase [Leifsonia sp. McL0607]|uniref:M60 family metallopeptidase n=1 Tax=Leifsonia sp. McL0607 TaxID=3415672 RepID=UPI003CFA6571
MTSIDRSSEPPRFSRRTAVAMGAWSVPAIVATTSAPAFAVSQAPAMLVIDAPTTIVAGVPATVTLQLAGAGTLGDVAVEVRVGGGLDLVAGGAVAVFLPDRTGRIVFDVVGAADGTIAACVATRPEVAAAASIAVTDSLVVTDAVSHLVLRVQPSASYAAAVENRAYPHSDFQPTGRYARVGEELRLTTEHGGGELAVGLWGVHAGHNGGTSVGVSVVPGSGSGAAVIAPRDGMVYVVHTADTAQSAQVTGGSAVPTFIRGRTSLADFQQQLAERSSAPFVELISHRMFGDFRRSTVAPFADRVPRAVADWDAVIAETDRVYGLRSDFGGVAHKHLNRIHISNPDTGAAYASATHFRITFQNDTGAGSDLFRLDPSALWGLWHEVGHTYQSPQYTWQDLVEVTVNISSLARQEAGGWPSRLDTNTYRSMLAQFRLTPAESRSYDGISDLFLKVLMFDQLRRAFGVDFYPRLHQEYRVARATGVPFGDGRQTFMRTAARVATRDLSRFFAEWGLAADTDTAAVFARYPAVETSIWTSVDRATDPRVDTVVAYSVPTGSASLASPSVVVGWSDVPGIVVGELRDSLPVRTVAYEGSSVGITSSPLVALAAVLLRNSAGIPNALVVQCELKRGTSFEFQGLSDLVVAWVALDSAGGLLRAGSTSAFGVIHPYFPGVPYFAVTVSAPDGTEIARAWANGDQNADGFAYALDGTVVEDGTVVTVEHREPSRLLRWDRGTKQPASTSTIQRFMVSAGTLNPV